MQTRVPLKSFRELIAWQRAMSLVDAVHVLCVALRKSHSALAAQMERAAISIPANIAEGYGRSTRGEYLRFLSIAVGSLRELETLVLIAVRRGLGQDERVKRVMELADETGRVVHGLRKSLNRDQKPKARWPS